MVRPIRQGRLNPLVGHGPGHVDGLPLDRGRRGDDVRDDEVRGSEEDRNRRLIIGLITLSLVGTAVCLENDIPTTDIGARHGNIQRDRVALPGGKWTLRRSRLRQHLGIAVTNGLVIRDIDVVVPVGKGGDASEVTHRPGDFDVGAQDGG